MNERHSISRWQQVCVGFLCILSPIIRLLPRQTALLSGPYAWLAALLAAIPVVLLFMLIRRFFKYALPGEGFAELFLRAVGAPIGRCVLAVFTIWLLLYGAFTLRSAADRYISSAYPNSSPTIFVIVLLLLALIAALGKFRAFSRTAEVFFPLLFIVLIVIFLMAIPDVDTAFLPPFTISQTPQVLRGVPPVSLILSLSAYFGFLEGRVRERKRHLGAMLIFLIMSIAVVVMLCVTTVGAFGAASTSKESFPFFILIKNLSAFGVIYRLEALILALWVVSDFVLITTTIFILVNNLRVLFGYLPNTGEDGKFFEFKNGRWLIWLVGAALPVLALTIARDSFSLSAISNVVVPLVNLCLIYGILPLVILVGIIRRRV